MVVEQYLVRKYALRSPVACLRRSQIPSGINTRQVQMPLCPELQGTTTAADFVWSCRMPARTQIQLQAPDRCLKRQRQNTELLNWKDHSLQRKAVQSHASPLPSVVHLNAWRLEYWVLCQPYLIIHTRSNIRKVRCIQPVLLKLPSVSFMFYARRSSSLALSSFWN